MVPTSTAGSNAFPHEAADEAAMMFTSNPEGYPLALLPYDSITGKARAPDGRRILSIGQAVRRFRRYYSREALRDLWRCTFPAGVATPNRAHVLLAGLVTLHYEAHPSPAWRGLYALARRLIGTERTTPATPDRPARKARRK